ncbi:MAG: lysophospholipid acyltransferase family protein [Sphaerochaetaceae bacterium]
MKALAKVLHHVYRFVVKTILQISYDFCVWQEEELPSGPKIFCSNHFSSSDVHFVTTLMKDNLHMVIGRAYGIPVIRRFLQATEQIKALTPQDKRQVVGRAVRYLEKGDSVYIFPEGMLNTQSELMTFRPGIAKMYLRNPVPIIPIGLIAPKRRVRYKFSMTARRDMTVVSRNYYANIGRPMEFPQALEIAKTDQKEAEKIICVALSTEVQRLIDDIKNNKFWS